MIDMVAALQKKSLKAELLLFESEGHGFRQADTIRRQLIKQLEFFNGALGLENTS